MKVKLLKKIRKRYEIVKVTSVSPRGNNWSSPYNDWETKLGLPFYVLSDNQDSLGYRVFACSNLCTAIKTLSAWIKKDYARTKNIKTIEGKVWYPKTNK